MRVEYPGPLLENAAFVVLVTPVFQKSLALSGCPTSGAVLNEYLVPGNQAYQGIYSCPAIRGPQLASSV